MSLGSSSSAQRVRPLRLGARTGLPLVPCPKCGKEILELTTGPGSKVPGPSSSSVGSMREMQVPTSSIVPSLFNSDDTLVVVLLYKLQDSTTCPWYLFADKYEKLLIAKGLVEKRGTTDAGIRQEDSMNEVEQIKIAIGRLEGVVEANKTELTPLLADVVSLKNRSDRVAEKLQKLVDLGKIVAVCLVVAAVFLVLGVITMFFM